MHRVTILSLRKRRTGSLKVIITSVDARYSTQYQVKSKKDHHVHKCRYFAKNQVRSKKKVITFAGARFSAHNQVKSRKKGHHVRRCPIFGPKLSEEQKKGDHVRGP